MADLSIRERCERRLAGLKSVRQPWEADWQRIAMLAAPTRSRFLSTSKSAYRTFNPRLQDGHAIRAFRMLRGGMTSGLSSPSRPWFRLTTHDDEVLNDHEAKEWLETVERQIYALFARTNFYDAAKSGYGEIGLFGTEACVMVEHWRYGAVCHALTAGEYWLDQSDANMPDALYRRLSMTVIQAVERFVAQPDGSMNWDALSSSVKNLYDQSNYNGPIEFIHAIEPNPEWSPDYADFRGKAWRSVWWECGSSDRTKLALQSGYAEQPFWAPRWDTTGGDPYGMGPGHDALPDMRVLQAQSIRKGQATDMAVDPEIVGPASVASKVKRRPGNFVAVGNEDVAKMGPLYQVPYQTIEVLREDIDDTRKKIDEAAYADLFNAITNMAGVQPRTVEEIAARNEEKLTQLGPVIERVNVEKLQVAIERAYGILSRGRLLPPVPQSLHMIPLKVDFVSILTQMQRMIGLGQIERTLGFVGNMAAAFPSAIDKIDSDAVVDEYADRAGMPPKLIRSDKEVESIRVQRAQQQAAAQAAAAMPAVKDGASAAQILSDTDTGGGRNALQAMLGQ